jgi:hypothetical protein
MAGQRRSSRRASAAASSSSYPLLVETQGPQRAAKGHPAAGPTYTSSVNGGATPTMPEGDTLYELFM